MVSPTQEAVIMALPHQAVAGVRLAERVVERARATNRALFARFDENPVIIPQDVHIPAAIRDALIKAVINISNARGLEPEQFERLADVTGQAMSDFPTYAIQ